MDNPAIALIFVALVLIAIGVVLGRRRNELAEQGLKPPEGGKGRQAVGETPELDVTHPRPKLVEVVTLPAGASTPLTLPTPTIIGTSPKHSVVNSPALLTAATVQLVWCLPLSRVITLPASKSARAILQSSEIVLAL